MSVILVDEDEDTRGEPEDDETCKILTVLDLVEVDPIIEVSLSLITGISSPKTMKWKGQVWNQPVVTLIDPGATHNFISSTFMS